MNKTILTTIVSASLLALVFSLPMFTAQPTQALDADDFRAGNIISDSIFTNKDAMSESQIQSWLEQMNSTCLEDYRTAEPLGDNKYGSQVKASRAIWRAAQLFDINPQVLLATLQKEQGLITRGDCPDWRYNTAMGFGCPDGQPCDDRWYGLSRQLYQGARHFRGFYDNASGWWIPFTTGNNYIGYHPSGSSCGGSTVNIQNRSTVALYAYTPYQPNQAALRNLDGSATGSGSECAAYGNRNFWRDFNRWFGSTHSDNEVTFTKCGGDNYLHEEGTSRKRMLTPDAMSALGLSDSDFKENNYHCTKPTFELTLDRLMKSRNTGRLYLIDNKNAYRITSQSQANSWGVGQGDISTETYPQFNPSTIKLLKIEQGLPRIAKSINTESLYMIDDASFHPVVSADNTEDALRSLGAEIGSFSPGAILNLQDRRSTSSPLRFGFQADGNYYLIGAKNLEKITEESTSNWSSITANFPSYSQEALTQFESIQNTSNHFRDESSYYRFADNGNLETTPSADVARHWSSEHPEFSNLLAKEVESLVDAKVDITFEDFFGIPEDANIVIFSCNEERYLVERGIRTKRKISDNAIEHWGLDNAYFPEDNGRCSYPSYSLELNEVVRSRTTGDVYLTRNEVAQMFDSQDAASSWGIADLESHRVPQINSASFGILAIADEIEYFEPSFTGANIVIFSCNEDRYLVERGIRTKRKISDNAIEHWGLDNAYFPEDNGRCSYPSYSLELNEVVRSRTTGSEYLVFNQHAYRIHDDEVAASWNHEEYSNTTYPKFEGESIHFLHVMYQLPRKD